MIAAFYKATRPGIAGIYNRIVRWWERGKYSHVELIFSDGLSGSSSFEDGGVRLKRIDFHPEHWDFIELPASLELQAKSWFENNEGKKYDILGNVRFVFDNLPDDRHKFFCSESIAEALGIEDAWRFEPNVLAASLKFLKHVGLIPKEAHVIIGNSDPLKIELKGI